MERNFDSTELSKYIENLLRRVYPEGYVECPVTFTSDFSDSTVTDYVPMEPEEGTRRVRAVQKTFPSMPDRRTSESSSETTDEDIKELMACIPTTPECPFAESVEEFYSMEQWEQEQSSIKEQLASYRAQASGSQTSARIDEPCSSQTFLEALRKEIDADRDKQATEAEQGADQEKTVPREFHLGELIWRGFGHKNGQLPSTIFRKLEFLEKFKINKEADFFAHELAKEDNGSTSNNGNGSRYLDENINTDGMDEDTKKELKRAIDEKQRRLQVIKVLKIKKKFYTAHIRSTVYELERYKNMVEHLEQLLCLQGTQEKFPRKLRDHLGFWSSESKKKSN